MKKSPHGYKVNKNGWKYVSIHGSPYERGHAHGYLLASEIKDAIRMLNFNMYENYGRPWSFFIDQITTMVKPQIASNFPEFLEEMKGVAHGAIAGGTETSIDEIVAWNCYWTAIYMYPTLKEGSQRYHETGKTQLEGGYKPTTQNHEGSSDSCSAFMAVGSYTKDGKIVCGHNTFENFIDGQYCNVILDLKPQNGYRMLFQTFPGWISSGTDFFVTEKGIIGTETTIGGFMMYANKDPICCRIRNCMQYGSSLDDYVKRLTTRNSGDYANSWLFGDINTNEIMLLELGLNFHKVERKRDGYFIGFNAPTDPRIRNIECKNTGYFDIRRHQGARRVRLTQLMDKHKGKINIQVAKAIISDHYDVYLNKINPCSRTCCSHYDQDNRAFMSQADRPKPFQPRGAMDGKVIDTKLAKQMSLIARWGRSCGTPFKVAPFCAKHQQWAYLKPYLHDRPKQPWTQFETSQRKRKTTKRQLHQRKNRTKKH